MDSCSVSMGCLFGGMEMAGKVGLTTVSPLVSIHVVLDGFHVGVYVVINFMVVDFMVSWVRSGSSRNVGCGNMSRKVSGSRMASWQNMGMFNVWMGGSMCCTNVSSRNHMGKCEFVLWSESQ